MTRWNLAKVVTAECHLQMQISMSHLIHNNQRDSHFCALLRCDFGNRWVLEDAAIEELHYVEVRSYDVRILAQSISFGHGNIGLLQGVDDSILAVDFMRRLLSSAYTFIVFHSHPHL
jgi:hypothetical protein